MAPTDPLAGVTLEPGRACRWEFRFPDGKRIQASVTDVLLWELLRAVRK